MASKDDEQVLVVPAKLIESIGAFQGFCSETIKYLPALLDAKNQSFVARKFCESDPTLKQLIPYVVLVSQSESETMVFRYTRGSGQTEARLHAKQSIGIGGHIAIEDCFGSDLYRTGMQRELDEEMYLGAIQSNSIVGLIYDGSNDVGQVHLGIVHRIEVALQGTRPREDDLVDAGFQSLDEITAQYDRLETWSQFAFDAMFRTNGQPG